MGAENLSYLKSIETHARTFLPLNISAIGSVKRTKTVQLSRTIFTGHGGGLNPVADELLTSKIFY